MKKLEFIPSLDLLDIQAALNIVAETAENPLVYGYKLGFAIGLVAGLPNFVKLARKITNKPLIYDHQKAGTDIPAMGELFAETLAISGITEAIIFPQAGINSLTAFVLALKQRKIKPIVGGIMTHPGYLESEGGFISDNNILQIYQTAYNLGIQSFVVPLTRPKYIEELCRKLKFNLTELEFYSPGLGAQQGNIQEFNFLPKLKVIVGRTLNDSVNPNQYLQTIHQKALQGIL